MYAPVSALLNALAQHEIDFDQVIDFIDRRYDFSPTAFTNGNKKNAANENNGSCKVFSFAKLNHLNQLDTLALFAEYYVAVRDNPESNDHQNIRQFIHHGWAGIDFEGQALSPRANSDAVNQQAAALYAAGGSEFENISHTTDEQPLENQPGAAPTPNPASEKLVENTQNFTPPAAPKDADSSVDESSGTTAAPAAETLGTQAKPEQAIPVQAPDEQHATGQIADADTSNNAKQTGDAQGTDTGQLDDNTVKRLEKKADQAIAAAEATSQPVVPAAPGSSSGLATETTYYTDNDSVADDTATAPDIVPESEPTQPAQTHTAATQNASGQGAASAAEIAAHNAQHVADNPAEFIDEHHTKSDPDEPATGSPETSERDGAAEATLDTDPGRMADGHGTLQSIPQGERDSELTENTSNAQHNTLN